MGVIGMPRASSRQAKGGVAMIDSGQSTSNPLAKTMSFGVPTPRSVMFRRSCIVWNAVELDFTDDDGATRTDSGTP